MSDANYYYVNGQPVPLVTEPGVYGVKFKPGARTTTALSPQAQRVLRIESEHIDFIPNYGIQVYRTSSDRNAVPTLKREGIVEFATPAFRRSPESEDLMFATNRFVVQFKPDVTAEQITQLNEQYHVYSVEPLGYAENGYLLEVQRGASGTDVVAIANAYFESGLTLFAHPDFVKKLHRRTVTSDRQVSARPRSNSNYLEQQWHLKVARVIEAWEIAGLAHPQGSPDITIAIMDDGVDILHPEFDLPLADGKPKVAQQYDFSGNVTDGTPKTSQDNHGTACAGVATAGGIKAYGAAPGCKLMAVRTPEYLGVADEAKMFQWAAVRGADVISCSWGPQDGIGAVEPLADSTRAAIRHCLTKGRQGKGIAICWAAGNGSESLDKDGQPRDGYAANPDVMAIAASTSKETQSWYSDYGPEICVCAPSSGDRDAGEQSIFTVDRRGNAGYNSGSASQGDASGYYTNDFGGTSSAAPLVAGITALLLSADPDLTPAEIREVLQQTADRIGNTEDYDAQGHSEKYGYGRVNACAAVQAVLKGGVFEPQPEPKPEPEPQSSTQPSIQAPASLARTDAAPTFEVDPSPNAFYIVEVATESELLDITNHDSDRSKQNFYGSWSDHDAHFSDPQYQLPEPVWDSLKSSDRLYYRIGTTTAATNWDNYIPSTTDEEAANAPYIEIVDTVTESSDRDEIDSPADSSEESNESIDSTDPFADSIDSEDVTEADSSDSTSDSFDDSSNGDASSDAEPEDTDSTSGGSKEGDLTDSDASDSSDSVNDGAIKDVIDQPVSSGDPLNTAGSPTPPRTAPGTTGSQAGVGYTMYEDEVRLGGTLAWRNNNPGNIRPGQFTDSHGAIGKGWGFAVFPNEATGMAAIVALLKTQTYQSLTLKGAIFKYAPPSDNNNSDAYVGFIKKQTGLDPNRLMSSLSDSELEAMAGAIRTVEGWKAGTTYSCTTPNAPDWARQALGCPALIARKRLSELMPRGMQMQHTPPAIEGPETYDRTQPAPTFLVMPGDNAFYAVEVATESKLFNRANYEAQRSPQTFFGSWQDSLQPAYITTTYTLPESVWAQLRQANTLYYRMMTTASDSTEWINYQASTPDQQASDASAIQLKPRLET